MKKIKPFLWISVLGFLLYLPSLFFDFSYLDDNVLILDNLNFLTNASNLFRAFGQDVFHVLYFPTAYYRPILTISFMFDSWIAGATPFFYHLSNILIHILTANLVFIFLRKINIKQELSFLGALIFAVHPVLTQAVSWIPGRNDSLLLLFVLSSFIFLINRSLFLHFTFFALAIFTKESAIVLIPLFVFYIWLISETKSSKSDLFDLAIGWFGIISFWFLLREHALINQIPMSFGNALQAIAVSSPSLIQFVGKIFIPVNLSVLPIIQDTSFLYGIFSLFLFFIFIFYGVKKKENYWQYCLFGLLWFLAFLVPSFVKPTSAIAADFIEHRLYAPIIGILIILFKSPLFEKIEFNKKKVLIICGIIVLLLGLKNLTYQQNFKNRLAFWQNAAQNSPHSPLAHRNLGVMLYFENRFDEALNQYQKALELNPQEPMAHNNMGVILMNQNKLDEAKKEFLAELKINPYYDNALSNLALIYYKQNKKEEAVKLWQEVIKINPGYLFAYKNLIIYYQEKADFKQANYYYNILQKFTQTPP